MCVYMCLNAYMGVLRCLCLYRLCVYECVSVLCVCVCPNNIQGRNRTMKSWWEASPGILDGFLTVPWVTEQTNVTDEVIE